MNTTFNIAQSAHRNQLKEEGFYDGRWKSRVVSDKKKNVYMKMRKNKNVISQYK